MKYHQLIKYKTKAIFAWSDLFPYPSVMQIITHLESGVIFNNKRVSNYKLNDYIYNKFYHKPIDTSFELNSFKLILFWRNPYFRLLSDYFEKYNLNTNQFSELTFERFIVEQTEDFTQHEIMLLDKFIMQNFQLYENLNASNCFVAFLPNSFSTTSNLFYQPDIIESLYEFVWRKKAFEKINHIYSHHAKDNIITTTDILQTLFNEFILQKINKLIETELSFFHKLQINFNI
jgi:hypothetical protein